jgi:protein phosphatase
VTSAIGLDVAALTDVGMRRTTNQDSHALLLADSAAAVQSRGHLVMVADGMGAHAAGELASKLAAEGIPHLYHKYQELSPPDALLRAISETNTEINRRGTANTAFHGMGTTCSTLVLMPQGALAAHVGDSRIYRLRDRTLNQLTFDHSLQWELRASGQLPEGADISAVVPKNVITRSLGPHPTVQIDLEGPHPIVEGDVYLLCSDGLTGRVEDGEIGAILGSLPPQEAVQALVDLANLRGGPDNVTVIVAKVIGPELTSAADLQPLTTGAKGRIAPLNSIIWVVALVCILATVILGVMGHIMAAEILFVAAGIATLAALIHRNYFVMGTELGRDKMLGRGPYVSVNCEPSYDLAQKLADTLDELREAARDGEWTINWQPLDDSCRQAVQAEQAGTYAEAVRHYCVGISYVMNELRLQNVK